MAKKDGSFVVISDFHSYSWPLEKVIKYYINEYDKVYILGDATDRGEYDDGTGGIDLLFQIKELTEKYPGKVFYVPGNHDEFVYGYAKDNDSLSEENLLCNHGVETINAIVEMEKDNLKKLNELIDWLGKLPLQREHFYKGKRYVLAHALFDETLFKRDRHFSLRDYRIYGGNHGAYEHILWFRKTNDDFYDESRLPEKGTTMIIGHTPLRYRAGLNLDLVNEKGDTIPVYCVDGGVAYDGRMQKFSASDQGTGVYDTLKYEHIDRGDKHKVKYNTEEIKRAVDHKILYYIERLGSLEKTINKVIALFYNEEYDYVNCGGEAISVAEAQEYINDTCLAYQSESVSYEDALKIYFTEVVVDKISESLLAKYKKQSHVSAYVANFIEEEDSSYITRDGGARLLALKLGIDNIKNWYINCSYPSYSDYLAAKFGNQYKK